MFAPASLPHHYDPLQYCWYSIVKDMKEIPLNLIDFHNSEQLQQLKLTFIQISEGGGGGTAYFK